MNWLMREEFKKAYKKAQDVLKLIHADDNKMVRTADIVSCVEKELDIDVKFKNQNFSIIKDMENNAGRFSNYGAAMCVKQDNDKKTAFVLLNDKETPEMKRFSLVHELGHLMLDSNIFDGKYKICTHIDMDILSIPDKILEKREYEFLVDEQAANIFALVVLLPYAGFKKAIDREDIQTIANRYGVNTNAVISRLLISREEVEKNVT